jgi:hypothetical protein
VFRRPATAEQEASMSSRPAGNARTIVITGGNAGLGYGCAIALMSSADGPWHVVTANAYDPGMILGTGLQRSAPAPPDSSPSTSFPTPSPWCAGS